MDWLSLVDLDLVFFDEFVKIVNVYVFKGKKSLLKGIIIFLGYELGVFFMKGSYVEIDEDVFGVFG